MSGGRPTMKAFVVEDKEEGSEEKPFWTRVGQPGRTATAKASTSSSPPALRSRAGSSCANTPSKDAQEDDKKVAKFKKK